ncbi:hypothetical protein ACIPWL_22305 [Streptomyces sp. NPDC090023]|uniref:hypothetical protein n=1 Tax=unclassified Streptomyces TaxID=2593676 RepID=UPI0037F9C28D
MNRLLSRRVAAMLLLLQFGCQLLLLVAFKFAYSSLEAELDHNAVSVSDRVLIDLIAVAGLVGVMSCGYVAVMCVADIARSTARVAVSGN